MTMIDLIALAWGVGLGLLLAAVRRIVLRVVIRSSASADPQPPSTPSTIPHHAEAYASGKDPL